MRNFLLILVNLLVFSSLLSSQSTDEQFANANQAYEKKNYDTAIQTYEKLLDAGYQSGELEYNLANSYYQINNVGQSILHYERALRFRPNDKDINHNIALAKERLQDDILPTKKFFLSRWWTAIRDTFSSGIWSFLSILMVWLGVAGLLFWQFAKERSQRKKSFFGGLTAFVLAILFFALANTRAANEMNSGQAIIVAGEATLRAAPEDNGSPIRALHAGTKVGLIDTLTTWYKVELTNSEIGWMHEEDLEKI